MKLTVDDIVNLGVCWTREKIEKYFGKRKHINLKTIMYDENLYTHDRIHLGIKLLKSSKARRLFLCDCIEHLCNCLKENNIIIDTYGIDIARKYENSEVDKWFLEDVYKDAARKSDKVDFRSIHKNVTPNEIDVIHAIQDCLRRKIGPSDTYIAIGPIVATPNKGEDNKAKNKWYLDCLLNYIENQNNDKKD